MGPRSRLGPWEISSPTRGPATGPHPFSAVTISEPRKHDFLEPPAPLQAQLASKRVETSENKRGESNQTPFPPRSPSSGTGRAWRIKGG